MIGDEGRYAYRDACLAARIGAGGAGLLQEGTKVRHVATVQEYVEVLGKADLIAQPCRLPNVLVRSSAADEPVMVKLQAVKRE
jgi:hypothetical protein